MKTWTFISNSLDKKLPCILLYVVASEGSSPGRKGFMMAVNSEGIFEGTIGGGIMEVKMIELAKSKLLKGDDQPEIRQQFHDKVHAKDQSGMICSGSQTIAIMPVLEKDRPTIERILKPDEKPFKLHLGSDGIHVIDSHLEDRLHMESTTNFSFVSAPKQARRIHIFGGGHVGLALARQLSFLDYRIIQYEDRAALNTLEQNRYAEAIKIIDYEDLLADMTFEEHDAVVIVSFSYRSDKIILKQLYNKSFAFIGMMGSEAKIASLREELEAEGIEEAALDHVFMPIGINIFSKTAAEIAVSIAGQIICEFNKNLPTGRTYGYEQRKKDL